MNIREIKEDLRDHSRIDTPLIRVMSLDNFEEWLRDKKRIRQCTNITPISKEQEFIRDYCYWFYQVLLKLEKKKWWEFWK